MRASRRPSFGSNILFLLSFSWPTQLLALSRSILEENVTLFLIMSYFPSSHRNGNMRPENRSRKEKMGKKQWPLRMDGMWEMAAKSPNSKTMRAVEDQKCTDSVLAVVVMRKLGLRSTNSNDLHLHLERYLLLLKHIWLHFLFLDTWSRYFVTGLIIGITSHDITCFHCWGPKWKTVTWFFQTHFLSQYYDDVALKQGINELPIWRLGKKSSGSKSWSTRYCYVDQINVNTQLCLWQALPVYLNTHPYCLLYWAHYSLGKMKSGS